MTKQNQTDDRWIQSTYWISISRWLSMQQENKFLRFNFQDHGWTLSLIWWIKKWVGPMLRGTARRTSWTWPLSRTPERTNKSMKRLRVKGCGLACTESHTFTGLTAQSTHSQTGPVGWTRLGVWVGSVQLWLVQENGRLCPVKQDYHLSATASLHLVSFHCLSFKDHKQFYTRCCAKVLSHL